MPTWILEDDCLTPDRVIKIEFKGLNPFRLYHAMPGFLRAIFDVRGKDVYEKDFRWDFTSEPRWFFSKFIVRKGYDIWSTIWAEVTMQGTQPSDPNKEGEMFVLITGKLLTRSPENTIWSRTGLYKSLRWLYFRTLYNDVRRNYLEECRIKLNDLKLAIERTLGIAPEAVMR
ncbi:MAG: hypothetical protein QW818_03390 [Candidatus Aenigmatarchaeota archaeon]|nr:hypothetical protein [Candidatus Aenigmarchaeota archaeon]